MIYLPNFKGPHNNQKQNILFGCERNAGIHSVQQEDQLLDIDLT